MKISRKYLLDLIIETLSEADIYGYGGHLISTDPPKTKYNISDEDFFEIFKPLVAFSQLPKNDQYFISIDDLIRFLLQRKDMNAEKITIEFNTEFGETGAKFNTAKIKAILNYFKEENVKSTSQVKKRLNSIKGFDKPIEYKPDEDAPQAKKTVSMGPIREKYKIKCK